PQSPCTLSALDLRIFDRWGNQVFQNRSTQDLWTGVDARAGSIPAGVYVARLVYTYIDLDGNSQEGSMTQDVVLVR
ncbi:MAG: gliding motility-associated C-terminal domain-containing protein, partial [Saprospiraceae bacterium]|nr:gliding motility-associated C-terminal domain-containing protein [Saprospiraceae bacterium]